MAVYFTADTHFGHAKVLDFCARPWDTVERMNEALVARINERVGYADDLYVLGDFSYRINIAQAQAVRERIRCRNVHLLPGNHDRDWTRAEVEGTFACEPPILVLKPEGAGGRKLVLSHYPMMDWPSLGHGSIHLHGHIHATREYNEWNRANRLLRYDVGVDANGYYPVSLGEVLAFFDGVEHLRRADWRAWAAASAPDPPAGVGRPALEGGE